MTLGIEHIGAIIARMGSDEALQQTRWLAHAAACHYWERIEPSDCDCPARPVIDLLRHIANRKAAA